MRYLPDHWHVHGVIVLQEGFWIFGFSTECKTFTLIVSLSILDVCYGL